MIFEFRTQRKRQTLLHQAVLWGMVAFYLLASGRALVPGLCATIAAAESKGVAAIGATRSCCQVPRADDGRDESTPTAEGEGSGCAFCHLVQSFGPIPVYVHAPEPWTAHYVRLDTPSSPLPALAGPGAPDGRAPPA